jgi:hypothetical protein
MRNLILLAALMASLAFSCMPNQESNLQQEDWKAILEKDLHLLGHRNWILVVDKAFPEQSSPGMKYLYVDEDLLPTLAYVLEQVEASSHVRPIIYRDKELSYISGDQVPGIDAFRTQCNTVLEGRDVNTVLHDEVFQMLDKSSSLFRTLVIKTNCTLPYTSVFMQLDCAYWDPVNEKILRDQISQDKSAMEN